MKGVIKMPSRKSADDFVQGAEQALKPAPTAPSEPEAQEKAQKTGVSRVTLDLDKDAYEQIKVHLADDLEGMKMADFLRSLIERYFDDMGQKVSCEPAIGYTALTRKNGVKPSKKRL